jgi:hypothetical protein
MDREVGLKSHDLKSLLELGLFALLGCVFASANLPVTLHSNPGFAKPSGGIYRELQDFTIFVSPKTSCFPQGDKFLVLRHA